MTQEIGIRISVDSSTGEAGLHRVSGGLDEVGNAAQRAGGGAAKAGQQVEISAKQMQAALRGVPAQFTDIVTALAGGQAPMTVFLQQGGQLKDMFGGAGNAARALGGYVAGMVNPVTVAAAAVGTLALAYYQGSAEADAFSKALILNGNAANSSVDELKKYSRQIAESTGATKGAAADAVQQLAATGKVGSGAMMQVAEAAIAMNRATGKAIDETVKEFEALGKSPVSASLKLNEQYNYLTASVYKQIKALEDQGKASDAAAMAQKAYADTVSTRAKAIEADLGALEKVWKSLGDVAKGAWDGMLDVGREGDLKARIDALKAKLQASAEGKGWIRGGVGFGGEEAARTELAVLEAQLAARKKNTEEAKGLSDQAKAALKWETESDKYLTKEAQQLREIALIRREGAAAGISQKEIDARVFAVQRGQISAGLDQDLAKLRDSLSQKTDLINAAVKLGTKSEIDGIEEVKAARIAAAQAEVIVLSKKLATTDSPVERKGILADMDRASAAAQKAISDADVSLKSLEEKHQAALGKFSAMAVDSISPLETAWLKFWNENSKTIKEAQQNGWTDTIDMMSNAWANVARQANFSDAKQQYDALMSEMQAQIEAVRQAAERDGGLLAGLRADASAKEITDRYIPALNELIAKMKEAQGTGPVNEKTVTDSVRATQKIVNESSPVLNRFFDDIRRGMTDGIFRGLEKGGKDGAKVARESIINTMKSIPIKLAVEAVVNPVMGAARSMFGGQTGAGGSSGGDLSQLLSFFGSGSDSGAVVGSTTIANGVGMTGGDTLGTFMDLNAAKWGTEAGNSFVGAAGQALGYVGTGFTAYSAGQQYGAAGGLAMSAGSIAAGGVVSGAMGIGSAGAAAAAAGGGLAGAGAAAYAALTAVPVWGWAALAALAIFGSMDKAGGPKSGGDAAYSYVNGAFIAEGDPGLYTPDSANAQMAATLQPVLTGLEKTVTLLGGAADKLGSISLGYDTDPSGTAPNRIKSMVNGKYLSLDRDLGRDAAALQAGLATEINRITVGALKDIDLADWADGILAQIDPATASAEQLGAALAQLNGMAQLTDVLGQLGIATDKVTMAMVNGLGGFDATKTALVGYFGSMYSEEEQLAINRRQLAKQFGALNLTMPATEEGFRRLVETLVAAGDGSVGTVTQLLKLAPAFSSVTKAMTASTSDISALAKELRAGDAGDMTYAQAQARFSVVTAQARAGDRTALSDLPEVTRNLVSLAEENTASAVALRRLKAMTANSLDETSSIVLGRLPSYDIGTNYVPRDTLALIHEGEAIVPKAFNPAAFGGDERIANLLVDILRELSGSRRESASVALAVASLRQLLLRLSPGGDALAVRAMA